MQSRLVLVVEDNLETADVLRRILALRNYRVVAAYDGLDAMKMLRDGLRPAVIVLDLSMPNMSPPAAGAGTSGVSLSPQRPPGQACRAGGPAAQAFFL